MRMIIMMIFVSSLSYYAYSQITVKGRVGEVDENGRFKALTGVNITMPGNRTGTTTDREGYFYLNINQKSGKLVFSMIGYISDTVVFSDNSEFEITLKPKPEKIGEIEIVKEKPKLLHDYFNVHNRHIMTDKELYRAACCNLSESFETNASVDVSFTDAITGRKQIEMLGLSGIYTQTTVENLPFLRGLLSNAGLSFIPGPWVASINISKGTGSVINGFESMTGQIDIDIRKPTNEEEKPIYANIYGDFEKRFEGNLNLKSIFNENLSAMTFLHYSQRKNRMDGNNDKFVDVPLFNNFNIMQRWALTGQNGWESHFGYYYVNDKKEGGTISVSSTEKPYYLFKMNTDNYGAYMKTGYVFKDKPYKSFGVQLTFNNYVNGAEFGLRKYSGNQRSGFINFIYQSVFDTIFHKFRTGVSFHIDDFKEKLNNDEYKRTEKIPGVFFEYTYTMDESFSIIAGIRGDYHNYYGLMLTPRFHMRYAPSEEWVFRGVAGRGFRTSNIFNEYISVLTSSRNIIINKINEFGFGLEQEKAWNYGLSLTHYFYYDYRDASVSIDFYRTNFENATIADLDSNPEEARFSSLRNGVISNSFQAELNIKPLENIDLRLAYRYLDVRQKVGTDYLERPFNSRHRALITFNYTTDIEENESPLMQYDLTIQWFDKKRIPSTAGNPEEYRMAEYSPSFFIVNAQINRTLIKGLDFYIGVENLFNFIQSDRVINPSEPEGKYFDASLIWGPVSGRMIYAGLRFGI